MQKLLHQWLSGNMTAVKSVYQCEVNSMDRPILATIRAIVLMAGVSFAVPCVAQDSNFSLNVHANSHATAKDIGLPEYPGATLFKDKNSDSSAADLGLVLNSFHISLKVASFVTTDSAEQVLITCPDHAGRAPRCGTYHRSDIYRGANAAAAECS